MSRYHQPTIQPNIPPSTQLQDPLDTHNTIASNFTHPRQPLAPFAHHPNTPPSSPSQNRFPPHHSGHSKSATSGSSKHAPTPAEAYASAHQHRKVPVPAITPKKVKDVSGIKDTTDRVAHQPVSTAMTSSGSGGGGGGGASKPIFDWISRKLGGNRRASIAEPSGARGNTVRNGQADDTRTRYPSLPRNIRNPGLITSGDKASGPSNNGVKGNNTVAGRPSITAAPVEMQHPNTVTPLTAHMHLIPIPDHPRPRLTPSQIFPQTPARDSILSRSESHSLQSYSLFSASPTERDRRREANNPYPSMPIQMYRGSIMSSSASAWASTGQGDRSVSFRTRSRSPSVRSRGSISSSLRPRISISDDRAIRLDEDGGTGATRSIIDSERRGINLDTESDHRSRFSRTPVGADENASIRPLPPSHPPSPTPSQSLLTRSRSASTSLLSPRPSRPRSPTSTSRIARQHSGSSIGISQHSEVYDDSIEPGRQSRQDSTSTKPTTIVSFEDGQVGHIAQVPMTVAAAPTLAPATVTTSAARHTSGLAAVISPPIAQQTMDNIPNSSISHDDGIPSGLDRPAQISSFPNSPASYGIDTPTPASPTLFTAPSSPLRSPLPLNGTSSDTPSDANNTDHDPSVPHIFQAQPPKHTLPHPMYNPRPSSPPDDNASTLTLASSTFAYPPPVTPGGMSQIAPGGTGSIHRPTSISRLSIISNPGSSALVPGATGARATHTSAGQSISPTVTFAPIPSPDPLYSHRPTSIAPSHVSLSSENYPPDSRRPPSLASPLSDPNPNPNTHTPKEYAPTLGTKGSTHTWGWMSRYGVDEKASTRAVRRKGSEGSVGSFESRWSWVQPTQVGAGGGGGVVSPGSGSRRISHLGGNGIDIEERRSGSLVR